MNVVELLKTSGVPPQFLKSALTVPLEEDLVAPLVINDIDAVLMTEMEKELAEFEMPKGLLTAENPNSKWRIVSCMQKAIRHGDVEMAMNAAHAASCIDVNYLYRRLGICSIEDVGIGNLKFVAYVMAALASKPWRAKVGMDKLAVWLAKNLAEGVKDRLACEFCVWVDFNNDWSEQKISWAELSDDELIARMNTNDLGVMMMAAWLLAGTNKFWGMTVPKSNDRPRLNLMRQMAASKMPLILYYIAEMVARRCAEGMFVSILPIWKMLSKNPEMTLRHFPVPPIKKIGQLTSAAYDMHTREGKISLSKFLKECRPVARFLDHVEDREMRNLLIGCGVFCAEGGVLEKRWSFPESEHVYDRAHFHELAYPGLPGDQHDAFLQTILEHLEELNECRRKVIVASQWRK